MHAPGGQIVNWTTVGSKTVPVGRAFKCIIVLEKKLYL